MGSNSNDSCDTHAADTVPLPLRRRWESAEGALFPAVATDPDLYERAVTAVQLTANTLRHRCLNMESLVAAWEAKTPAEDAFHAAQLSAAGLHLDLIASAAFALRFRELAADAARRRRLARLTQARDAGETWAVLEESGTLDEAPARIYQRTEVHVPSCAVVVMTVEPDESFSQAIYRIEGGRLDASTGHLQPEDVPAIPQSTYDNRATWESVSADIRRRLLEQ